MDEQIFPLLIGLLVGLFATYIIIKLAGRTDEKVKLMRIQVRLQIMLLKKSGVSEAEINEAIEHEKLDL